MKTVKELAFKEYTHETGHHEPNISWHVDVNHGHISVLDRLTGFGFMVRDIETGFRDNDGYFWLASSFDIRNHPKLSLGEAIKLVKEQANICVAVKRGNDERVE